MRSPFLLPLTAGLAVALASAGVAAQPAAPTTPLETIPGAPAPAPADGAAASRGEILAAKQFGWLDLDRDGFLSRDEVALFPRLRDAFDQADRDHDNRVSFDEIRALALQRRADKAADDAAAGAGAPDARPARAARPAKPS